MIIDGNCFSLSQLALHHFSFRDSTFGASQGAVILCSKPIQGPPEAHVVTLVLKCHVIYHLNVICFKKHFNTYFVITSMRSFVARKGVLVT